MVDQAGNEQTEQLNPATIRKIGAGLFIGSVVWIPVLFFIINPVVISIKLGGIVGLIWDLIFISFMLGGIYFLIAGLLSMITGKAYGFK